MRPHTNDAPYTQSIIDNQVQIINNTLMLTVLSLAFWLIAVIIAITVHEYAHAYMAERLGDPTARLSDRLSLNPLKHYDQVGTSMLLITAIMRAFGAPVIPFGWAKPVPFDPYNLQNPRRDGGLIALAGPVSNLVIALIASLILRLVFLEFPLINALLYSIITLNVSLAIFNLIPVHPLDGGKILLALLPKELSLEFDTIMNRFGIYILILLILPFGGQSAISALLAPLITNLLTLFLP